MSQGRNTMLVAGGAAAAVLVAVSLVVLYLAVGKYRAAQKVLAVKMAEMRALYARNPYPSQENVARERDYLRDIRERFAATRADLVKRGAGLSSGDLMPAQFISLFWNTMRRDLQPLARQKGIGMEQDFLFGFGRYREGTLPAKGDVPRLFRQLQIVRKVSDVLIASEVTSIQVIQREEFEVPGEGRARASAPVSRPRGSGDGAVAPALYDRERLVIRFSATEKALMNTLAALASHTLCIDVVRLEVAGDQNGGINTAAIEAGSKRGRAEPAGAPPDEPGAGAAAPPAEGAPPAGRQGVAVSGFDLPMQVSVTLDVFIFNPERKEPGPHEN